MILVAGVILLVKLGLVLSTPVPADVDLARLFLGFDLPLKQILVLGWLIEAGIVGGAYLWTKNRWVVLLLAASPWLNSITLLGPSWSKLAQGNFFEKIQPEVLAIEVDEIQKVNFLATGKTYIWPAALRKIVYNKAVLAGQKGLVRFVELWDLEQWIEPQKALAITSMSGLPPKGLTPLLYFWEILLIVVGCKLLVKKKNLAIFVLIALIPAMIFEKKHFAIGGLGLMIPLVMVIAKSLKEMPNQKIKAGIFILYLVGTGYFFQQLFFKQKEYRYSDAQLYYQTAQFIMKNYAAYPKFVTTERFGLMSVMLDFYGVPRQKVEVKSFEFNKESEPGVYIGLPREMAGSNPILKIDADDELVYGYGKGLWIGVK